MTRVKCIEMRRNHQILIKLDFGVGEGGHFMGQKKYTFHEIQCETFKLCLIHVRMVSRPAHVPIEALNEHFWHLRAFSTVFAL